MNIDLNEKSIAQLAAVAKMENLTPEALAARMLETQIERLARFEQEKAEDLAILTSMDDGESVANEDVMKWLESWGSDNELPCPTVTK